MLLQRFLKIHIGSSWDTPQTFGFGSDLFDVICAGSEVCGRQRLKLKLNGAMPTYCFTSCTRTARLVQFYWFTVINAISTLSIKKMAIASIDITHKQWWGCLCIYTNTFNFSKSLFWVGLLFVFSMCLAAQMVKTA